MPLPEPVVKYLKSVRRALKKQNEEKHANTIKDALNNASSLNEVPFYCLDAIVYVMKNHQCDAHSTLAACELLCAIVPEDVNMLHAYNHVLLTYRIYHHFYHHLPDLTSTEETEVEQRITYWTNRCKKVLSRYKKQLTDTTFYEVGLQYLNEGNLCHIGQVNIKEAENFFELIKDRLLRNAAYAQLNFYRKSYGQAIAHLNTLMTGLNKLTNPNDRKIREEQIHYFPDFLYGRCYQELNKNDEALKHLREVSMKGHIAAMYNIGMILESEKKYEEAAACYKKDAERLPDAAYNYYLLCRDGRVANEDKISAYPYLVKAKNLKHPEALYVFGQLCEYRNDYMQAAACYLANMLHLPSVLRLAQLYAHNKKMKNPELSRHLYESAANSGNPEAQVYVASAYWHGKRGFTLNKTEAQHYYSLAVGIYLSKLQSEPAHAHYMLARIYAEPAVNKLKEALRHSKKALQLKHPAAAVLLAKLEKKIPAAVAPANDNEINQEPEESIVPYTPDKEKTIFELMDEAHQAQADSNFVKALECWLNIKDLDDSLVIQVQVAYAIGNAYCEWSKSDDAPENAVLLAGKHLVEALALILRGLLNPNTPAFELSELESWQQFILETAAKFSIVLTQDEYVQPENIPEENTQKVAAPPSSTSVTAQTLPFTMQVTPAVSYICGKTSNARVVGGAVLDSYRGAIPNDFDMAVHGSLDDLEKLFGTRKIGHTHPVILVAHQGETIQTSCYDDPYQDYLNRDFTVNSLHYDPVGKIIAWYGDALEDVKNRIIRSILKAEVCLANDPARMLRAIRLAAKTGFSFEKELHAALCSPTTHVKLKTLNPDRLFSEVMKLFINPNNLHTTQILKELGLLSYFFPQSAKTIVEDHSQYHTAIQSALCDARQTRTDLRVINSALIVALLLFPVLNERLKGKTHNNETIEQNMKLVLDIHNRTTFPIPTRIYAEVLAIWRLYFVMINIYESHLLIGNDDFAHFNLAKCFFRYLKGCEFFLNAGKLRNLNEKVLWLLDTEKKIVQAVIAGNEKQLQSLLHLRCDYAGIVTSMGGGLLHMAAANGHAGVIKLLLPMRQLLASVDANLQTPLHYAATSGHSEAIQSLIAGGMDSACVDIAKRSALHQAAIHGHLDAVKMLLKTNPEMVNAQDRDGETALHIALKNHHQALAELLVEYNADVLIPDAWGKSPVSMALADNRLFPVLDKLINAASKPVDLCHAKVPHSVLLRCDPLKLTGLKEKARNKLQKSGCQFFSATAAAAATSSSSSLVQNDGQGKQRQNPAANVF